MKKFCLFLIIFAISAPAFAQNDTTLSRKELRSMRLNKMAKEEEEGIITYRKHFLLGLKLLTDGYGGFLEIGRAQSVSKSFLYQLEITERKHVKEDKFYNPNITLEPFIYGKINFFYPIKLGVQQQFLLGNKGSKNGVNVTGNVGGGIIAGLLRPYMVKVMKNGTDQYVGYESDSTLFLRSSEYGSSSGVFTGFNKSKITPGIYLKPALRFDYGKYNEMISALEVGATAEYYTKAIPQMAYSKYKKFFISAYVTVVFGKRK